MSRAETWIIEESEVDPYGKEVRCVTKNLDHVKIMQVEESVRFALTSEGYVSLIIGQYATLTCPQQNSTTYRRKNIFAIWLGPDKED